MLAAVAALGLGATAAHASPVPVAPPAGVTASPGQNCGFVTTPAHRQEMILVEQGTVNCARIRDVYNRYFQVLSRGRAPGAGAGPVQVDEWTCATNQDVMAPFNRCDSATLGQRTVGQFGPQ